MQPGGFVHALFGKGDRPGLALRHPVHGVRLVVPDQVTARPGWLARTCHEYLDRHGDRALQLVRPTGEALALVYSPRATVEAAEQPRPSHTATVE